MQAIIVTGGKQYNVSEGDTLFIEKLDVNAGDAVVFDQVLVGQVLCGLTCLQGLLYTVFYWHYDKVY